MENRKRSNSHHGRGKNGKISIFAIAGIASITLAVLLLIVATLSINLTLIVEGGNEPMILTYGEEYIRPEAIGRASGEDIKVSVFDPVNPNRVGSYEITYRVQHLWLSKTAKKVVRVVDTTAPEIILKTVPNYTVAPGEEYREEGYIAIDDYDGDITDKVQVQMNGDVIYYSVTDTSGNKATAERHIARKPIVDQKAPVITLKGGTEITINAGSVFTDPGYTATDSTDGDITDKVQISGSVNIYHAGTYTLTYTVSDKDGNTATVQRSVTVKAIQQPSTVQPNGKVIYLTFDDGPSRYTQQLLNVLEQYNAKATFFVVNTGYNMKSLLKGIVNGGHGIGMHSVTHKYDEIYASEEAFFADLYAMQQIIKDATGKTTTLMRFPGGSSNMISRFNPGIMTRLTQAVQDQGFQYFDWNVDSRDAAGLTGTSEEKTAQVVQNVINGIGNRQQAVVLQHDIQGFSVDAVEQILIWGISNGYSFQALTPNSPVCHHQVQN